MIRREELSAAIFAPGWVFETQDKTKFIENQNRYCVCVCVCVHACVCMNV